MAMADQAATAQCAIGSWADHDFTDSEEPSSVSSVSGKAKHLQPRNAEYRRRGPLKELGSSTAPESCGNAAPCARLPWERPRFHRAPRASNRGAAAAHSQPDQDAEKDFAGVVGELIGIYGAESTVEEAKSNSAGESTDVAPLKVILGRLQSMPGTTSEEMLTKLQFLCGSQEERFDELQIHFEKRMRASVSTTQFERWTQVETEEAQRRRGYKATLIAEGMLPGSATQSLVMDARSATLQVAETQSCVQVTETPQQDLSQASADQISRCIPKPPSRPSPGQAGAKAAAQTPGEDAKAGAKAAAETPGQDAKTKPQQHPRPRRKFELCD